MRDRPDDEHYWWETRWFAVGIVVAMALPLLWPTIPPLVDLMGHMGRYKVQLDLASSPYLKQFYDFHWGVIGNLGVDLLIMPLGRLFGVEWGVKIIIIAIPVLSTIGLIWISREVHGRVTPTIMLALPFVYGHPFQFGFVNFALGMALTFIAFALWLRLGRTGHIRLRAAAFVVIGLVIWTTHSFAWGVLGLLCFSADSVREHDHRRSWPSALWHAGLHCLPLAPPLLLMVLWRSEAQGATADWFNWYYKGLWALMALRDRWMQYDVLSIGLSTAALLILALWRPFEFSRNLAASAILLLITFICLPRLIFGSAYADMRLFPYVMLIAFLAIRPAKPVSASAVHAVAGVAAIFLAVRIAGHTASFVMYDRMHARTLAALDQVPRGARLLTLVGRKGGIPWYTDRQEHIAALAIVRREAFSNDQWVMKGAQLLRIRKTDAPRFDRDPSEIVKQEGTRRERWKTQQQALTQFPRAAFDYVWLITPFPFDPKLAVGMQSVWKNDRDTLYRVVSSTQPAATRRTVMERARQGDAQDRMRR